MSCWIVNDKVLSRIVDFIKYDQHKFGWGKYVCEERDEAIHIDATDYSTWMGEDG